MQSLYKHNGLYNTRFEDRDACEEVIKQYNNLTIKDGEEDLQVQIRYADTQEQKVLKQQTQAARQFRSAEYEYATQAWRQGRLPIGISVDQDKVKVNNGSMSSDDHNVPAQAPRWSHLGTRMLPGRSPLGAAPYTNQQTRAGSVNDNADANDAASAASPKPASTASAEKLGDSSVKQE